MIRLLGCEPTGGEPVAVSVERWYDRGSRTWIVARKDAAGQQVGDADLSGTLAGAKSYEDERRRELGLPPLPRGRR